MDVIAYKCPSIVGLAVYIRASQCIKSVNKHSISAYKTVSEPLADVFYLVALKEWSFSILVGTCTCTCLTLLASFFLPSHLSFKNMYIHVLNIFYHSLQLFSFSDDLLSQHLQVWVSFSVRQMNAVPSHQTLQFICLHIE